MNYTGRHGALILPKLVWGRFCQCTEEDEFRPGSGQGCEKGCSIFVWDYLYRILIETVLDFGDRKSNRNLNLGSVSFEFERIFCLRLYFEFDF